jgi:O-methyltransferase involved in polyketide biosynthesis
MRVFWSFPGICWISTQQNDKMGQHSMKNEQVSATARVTTAIRALHVLYDQPLIFNDTYALQFTSPFFQRVCRSRLFPWLIGRKKIAQMLQLLSAQVLSRAKYSEEKLEKAVSKGITQYVNMWSRV